MENGRDGAAIEGVSMHDPQQTGRAAASRRAFLTGSAAVAAGAVGSQLMPATANAEDRDDTDYAPQYPVAFRSWGAPEAAAP